jgi:hypothetical protein
MIRLTTLLPAQWRDAPRTNGLVSAIQTELDRLERAFVDIPAAIRAPYGAWLDLVGRVVGVQRGGRTDAAYYAAIQVWTVVRRSRGDWGSIRAVLAAMKAAAVVVTYSAWNMDPGRVRFDLSGVMSPTATAGALGQTVAAGIVSEVAYSTGTSMLFRLTSSTTTASTSTLAWVGGTGGDVLGARI